MSRVSKYDPSSSNTYPDDGRQFVLHVPGDTPCEVCMHNGELVEVAYHENPSRTVTTGNLHSVEAGHLWSHCAH